MTAARQSRIAWWRNRPRQRRAGAEPNAGDPRSSRTRHGRRIEVIRRPDVLQAARNGTAGMAVAVVVAVVWRIVWLVRFRATPLSELLEMDAYVYWAWSAMLRGGHWIGSH